MAKWDGAESRGQWVPRMAEACVDIPGHTSKKVNTLLDVPFDYVVTVCGHAHENGPFFPGAAKVVHVGFDNPPALARQAEGEEEKLACYRRVRDEKVSPVQRAPDQACERSGRR